MLPLRGSPDIKKNFFIPIKTIIAYDYQKSISVIFDGFDDVDIVVQVVRSVE